MPLPALRRPAPWFGAFAVWFGALWWLSSLSRPIPESVPFEVSDKVLHFGYFFGGAGLLSAALFLSLSKATTPRRIALAVVILALVGIIDEYHQSWVPGRSGNDPFDFLADVLGAFAGAAVFQLFRRFLRQREKGHSCPDPSCTN